MTLASEAMAGGMRDQADCGAGEAKTAAGPSDGGVVPRDPRPRRVVLLAAGLVVVIAAGTWLYGQLTHVVVDDARVAADVIAVSSRVAGRVTEVNTVAGDSVRGSVLLVAIDKRESRLHAQKLEARSAGIVTRPAEVEARVAMIDAQTES